MTPDNVHFVSYLATNYNTIKVRPFASMQAPAALPAPVPRSNPTPWQDRPAEVAQYATTERLYSYKVPKGQIFQPGDLVIAEMNGVLRVLEVVVVDAEPDLDFTISSPYKWIIQKLDTTDYDERLRAEKEFLMRMTQLEQNRRQRELRDQFMQQYRLDEEGAKGFDEALELLK